MTIQPHQALEESGYGSRGHFDINSQQTAGRDVKSAISLYQNNPYSMKAGFALALPQLVGDAMTSQIFIIVLLTLVDSFPRDVLTFRSLQADTMS